MRLSYDLKMVIDIASPELILPLLSTALSGRSWPSVVGTSPAKRPLDREEPKPRKRKAKSLDVFVQQALTLCKDLRSNRFWLADASRERKPEEGFHGLSMLQWWHPTWEKKCTLSMSLFPDEELFPDPAENVRALSHLARGLFRQGLVISAYVIRMEKDERDPLAPMVPDGVPKVPIAEAWMPLVVTDVDEVAKNYACPEDFFQAGWTVESLGAKRLLTRCQDVVTRADLLRKYGDMHWQMVRAANPGTVNFSDMWVKHEERDAYEQGERHLQLVHFDKFAASLEYTCSLKPGEHLQGRELFDLNRIVKDRFLPDWTITTVPVSVCVEFAEEWMAQSEKRPLLGLGVKVCYQEPSTGEKVWIET
jgi:hypothetical protein